MEEGKSDRKLQLGVCLVPWRVSGYSGGLSFQLAQDVSSFSHYVDIYSPMVYHKMVGKPVEWVSEISKYYSDRVDGLVWPIIQVVDVSADEFGVVVKAVSDSGADGLLVYSYRFMQEGQWAELSNFSPVVNLIENPKFVFQKGTEHIDYGDENLLGSPQYWAAGGDQLQDSKHMVQRFAGKERALGISSGSDRQGKWKTPLGACENSARYRFTNMAISRSQVVPEYQDGADYFMLDQYPVPNMPMTWLSDSMDHAAEYVGRDRLQAVVQAFGGEKYSNSGWPRLPTFEEMACLSYLAIVHGSRGLY